MIGLPFVLVQTNIIPLPMTMLKLDICHANLPILESGQNNMVTWI